MSTDDSGISKLLAILYRMNLTFAAIESSKFAQNLSYSQRLLVGVFLQLLFCTFGHSRLIGDVRLRFEWRLSGLYQAPV